MYCLLLLQIYLCHLWLVFVLQGPHLLVVTVYFSNILIIFRVDVLLKDTYNTYEQQFSWKLEWNRWKGHLFILLVLSYLFVMSEQKHHHLFQLTSSALLRWAPVLGTKRWRCCCCGIELLHRLCPSFRKPSFGETEPLPARSIRLQHSPLAWDAHLC